jgi:O-antigen/teichoic acid export membrane protein
MSSNLAREAGSGLFWKGLQLAGTKLLFLGRVLILARLLSPEDFGLLAIATITLGVLLCLTEFGLAPALVQRTVVTERHYHVAWTIGVVRGLVIAGVLALAAPVVVQLFAEPRAVDVVRLLALRPLLTAMASIRVADLTRTLQFRSLAILSLTEALANTLLSIALAPILGVWALVAGTLIGAGAFAVLSYILAPYRPRFALDRVEAGSLMRYGRWIFAAGVSAMAGSFLLQAVISRRLGVEELGLYFLAAKIAFLPYEVASEVIGAVAFPIFARLKSDAEQTARVFRTLLKGTAALLLPTYGLLVAVAPSLVQDLLGPRWAGTVPAIQVLAVAGMLSFLTDVTVPMFKGLGHPQRIAVLETVQGALLISFAWVLAGPYGLVGATLAWLPAIVGCQIVAAVYIQQVVHQPFTSVGVALIGIGVTSLAGAVLAASVATVVSGAAGLMLAVGLSLSVMAWLLWTLDRSHNLGLADIAAQVFPGVTARLRPSLVNG